MKLSLLSAIIVLAVAGFFGYKIYLNDQRVAQEIREQVQQEHKVENRRSQLEESVAVVESYRSRLSPEPEVGWLVQTVGELARESGVHLAAINPKRPRQLNAFTQLAVSLHLTTSYHRLGQLLSRLESMPQLLRVDHLEFTAVREDDGSTVADVDLVISTFHLPPVAEWTS